MWYEYGQDNLEGHICLVRFKKGCVLSVVVVIGLLIIRRPASGVRLMGPRSDLLNVSGERPLKMSRRDDKETRDYGEVGNTEDADSRETEADNGG